MCICICYISKQIPYFYIFPGFIYIIHSYIYIYIYIYIYDILLQYYLFVKNIMITIKLKIKT